MVACTLVVAIALLTYARRTRQDVSAVRATLTTTNGGSHVADALKRIERDIGGMRSELRHANGRIDHLDRRLDQHLDGKETR